jgi:cytochrome c oxidase subunit 2
MKHTIGDFKHFIIIGIFVIASTFLIYAGIHSIGLLPDQASLQAESIDQLMYVHVWIISFLFSLIMVTLSYSLIVFRRKKGETGEGVYMTGSSTLEVLWTFIPFIVVIILAYVGAGSLGVIRQVDPSAVTVKVIAQQWSWQFQYPDYGIVSTDLILPFGKQVDLQLTSRDVIHGFWIPEFRVKEDLVPGQTNDLRITPTLLGNYTLRCSVLCGTKHAYMLGKVQVLSQADFDAWVTKQQSVVITDPVVRGQLLVAQNGCGSCHSVDGTKGIGPTWARLYNSTVTLSDGTKVVADNKYLTDSIVDPNLQIVAGFAPNRMPNFSDSFTQQQIADIIAYIESLK